LPLLQARLGRPRSKVQVALGLLRRQKIVGVDAEGGVRLLKRGLEADMLGTLMTAYRDKRESDRETLERMVFYAQTGQCRWRVLLEHLEGEAPFERCKHCDNCLRIARQEEALARAEEAQVNDEAANDEHAPARAAFAAGDIVLVKRYGRGEVREATALEVTVSFADGSRRTFHPEFVRKARGTKQAAMAA
jgi:ATP-dependent DNA helicase RecQ